jgi:hypothetical protein
MVRCARGNRIRFSVTSVFSVVDLREDEDGPGRRQF